MEGLLVCRAFGWLKVEMPFEELEEKDDLVITNELDARSTETSVK